MGILMTQFYEGKAFVKNEGLAFVGKRKWLG